MGVRLFLKFPGPAKEHARENRRTVFTHEDWVVHRSTWRYFRHMKGLPASRTAIALLVPLLLIGLFCALICFYETLRMEGGYLSTAWPALMLKESVPFQMMAFAISLLLVFRTTNSYNRWAEARQIWGGILNRSRDLARQANSIISTKQEELRAPLLRWIIACPFSMKAHLSSTNDISQDLQSVLTDEELEALLAADHRPNFTISMMSEIVSLAGLDPVQLSMFDKNLTFMADSIGACERILKTPIPLSYTRHTSRFLIVFLFLLPFQLWYSLHWGAVPATLLISFFLLGIDEIGVMIEEPFSILALDAICETAKKNVLEISQKQAWAHGFLTRELNRSGDLSPKSPAWPPNQLQIWPIPISEESMSGSESGDSADSGATQCEKGSEASSPSGAPKLKHSDSVTSFKNSGSRNAVDHWLV